MPCEFSSAFQSVCSWGLEMNLGVHPKSGGGCVSLLVGGNPCQTGGYEEEAMPVHTLDPMWKEGRFVSTGCVKDADPDPQWWVLHTADCAGSSSAGNSLYSTSMSAHPFQGGEWRTWKSLQLDGWIGNCFQLPTHFPFIITTSGGILPQGQLQL